MSSHRRVRRSLSGRTILIVAVLGLALLGLGQCLPNRHSIEDNLTSRSQAALAAHGIDGVQVSFVGRDGTLTVPNAGDVERAAAVVRDVNGVRVVSAHAVSEPKTVYFRTPIVMVALTGSQAVLTGSVSSEQVRAALVAAIAGSRSVQDSLTLDAAVTDAGVVKLPAVVKAIGSSVATITLRDGRITLTGSVGSEAVRDAAGAAAAAAVGPNNVDNKLAIVLAPAVQGELAGLEQITFESGSATLTAIGRAAVAKAAGILKANPGVRVRVEGHTDSNGSDADNLVLSRARAQTVVNTLISLGIPPQQLSSVGYGETRPKVADDTPEHEAINRRVEFVVVA